MKSQFDRPVVFSDDDTLGASFYCDLFHMVDTYCGECGILHTDECLSVHFDALLKRLAHLAHWDDPACNQICVVGFGGDPVENV